MKICTIIGARPQFVKASMVSTALAMGDSVEEVLIHTGQHYDEEMSGIFFRELSVPREKYNLAIGSGPHGEQTGRMLEALEKVLVAEKPDRVLIYGDTNSTLAGALASVKLHIPTAHVEAGMRSCNRRMPEEVNRVVADHLCERNFCSCEAAVETLRREGRGETAILSGDVMYDCVLTFSAIASQQRDPLLRWKLEQGKYVLLTCHRAENTDRPERLSEIIQAVNRISDELPVLFPIHPRTKKFLDKYRLETSQHVIQTPPLGYFDMLLLEKGAKTILTDSGGVQKEAFFFGVPCVTMRDETEWVETVELGWNKITGSNAARIVEAVETFVEDPPSVTAAKPYGDGKAAVKIAENLMR